jgi:hypothetical protein
MGYGSPDICQPWYKNSEKRFERTTVELEQQIYLQYDLHSLENGEDGSKLWFHSFLAYS